jgi:hypothetical protein
MAIPTVESATATFRAAEVGWVVRTFDEYLGVVDVGKAFDAKQHRSFDYA